MHTNLKRGIDRSGIFGIKIREIWKKKELITGWMQNK